MTLPSRCSPDCVIPEDTSKAQPLSVSAREEDSWVIDGMVIRRIADGGPEAGHPFFLESSARSTIEQRAGLLRAIRDGSPEHVVPVAEVCACSYTSPLLAGHPIQDFGLGADGNSLIHPRERRIAWTPNSLEQRLAELVSGLAELHELGIAHGDPALMNGYVHTMGQRQLAVWVDLNSVQPGSPEAIAVDIAAFELTCLWPALLDGESHSPGLFRELARLGRESDSPLAEYASALSRGWDDHVPGAARADLLSSILESDPATRDDLLGATRRRIASAMAPTYFLDQTRSDLNARFFSATLGVERARHLLLEEERTRLHVIRYQNEIEALTRRAQTLETEVAGLQHEISNAAAAAEAKLEAAKAEIEDIHRELSNERAFATELGNDNALLRNNLNEIYVSRAWRLISRLRRIIGTPSRVAAKLRTAPEAETSAGPSDHRPSPKGWLAPTESYPFLVSVVMPVYNKGSTLRGSIESVLSQTLTSVEVLVWDDGSVDPETVRVLDEVAGLPDVTVFRAANQGVVGARNSAMSLSRGRYICCLDPDDEIAPTYLEMAVALLEAQPEYDIAYPWVHSIGDVEERWETQDLDPSLITRTNHLPVCAVFRREVFVETGGFSPLMKHGYEDWEFWVHAAELGFRGKSIPSHLLTYLFSLDSEESRDAQARERHQQLVEEIARLHPRLARTGVPFDRPTATRVRPVGSELGERQLPGGTGRPVVLFLPWFTIGGADRVVDSLCRHWVANGRTVVVFTTTPLAPGMSDRRHELDLVTPYVYPLNDFLPVHQWYEFVTSTVDALESPVIFNIGSWWCYDNAKALRRDFPKARIVDQQFNSLAHLPRNRGVAEVIDLTIAAYDGLAEEIANDGRLSPVAPIYVGIDLMAQPTPGEIAAFRHEIGISAKTRLALFVGRLADEKRPEWVIRLAAEPDLNEVQILIVGDGPLRDEVAKAADSLDRLLWIPELDKVEPAIAAADLLILPSKIEGIPLIVMEALALGTPLVATRVGGLPDLEDEEGITLTDPDDFDAFVQAVRKLIDADRGAIQLPKRFSADAMLEEYDRLLFGEE